MAPIYNNPLMLLLNDTKESHSYINDNIIQKKFKSVELVYLSQITKGKNKHYMHPTHIKARFLLDIILGPGKMLADSRSEYTTGRRGPALYTSLGRSQSTSLGMLLELCLHPFQLSRTWLSTCHIIFK